MDKNTLDELLDLFLRTNSLRALLDKAAQVLGNPLVVCDTSYHFLGHSDVQGIKDKSWLTGCKRGSWSYDFVSVINELELDCRGAEPSYQILDRINTSSTLRRKLGALCIDSAHVGYYLILEENTPFDSIPDWVYQSVARVLAKCVCVERPPKNLSHDGNHESIMLELLQNSFDSRSLFLKRAGKSEITRTGNWQVLCIPVSEDRREALRTRNLSSMIGQCLPLSWHVFHQDCIVILTNLSEKLYPHQTLPNVFRNFLLQHGLCAGQSDHFSDPYELKTYFDQAYAAIYLAQAFRDERLVIPYEDYKIYNLFLCAESHDPFTQFSSEAVRRVHEHDIKNGTQYMETLYHYLGCHCSVQKAAEKLFVHRNTVAYRVSRMKSLLGLSFDDDYQNYINFTSCLLCRYCNHMALWNKK